MLSRTKGRKIAVIKGKGTGRTREYIYLNTKESIDPSNTTSITIDKGKLQPLPNPDIVEKIYVSAPSGSGKSTFVSNWVNEAYKMKPFYENEFYVFSTIDDDECIDKLDPLRIELDDLDLVDNPLSGDEFIDSIVLFDDTDTLQNPLINKAILDLKDYLLEQGRHFNTRMLITSHLLSDREKTRRTLNEATAVCFFPRGGGKMHIKNFLKNHIGLSKSQIKKMVNLKSRWVCLYTTYPMYVISEKTVYMLNDDEGE